MTIAIGDNMVDVSNKNVKIPICLFEDMMNRVENYRQRHGKNPKQVSIVKGLTDYITYDRYQDMLKRYKDFIEKEKRKPLYIWIKYPMQDISTSDDCVYTGYHVVDYQDTSYSCGASSLYMALTALGVKTSEREIMEIAGTNVHGTTHDGMLRAIRHYGLHGTFKTLDEVQFIGIYSHIKLGGEVILHVKTGKLQYDCKGNRIWRGDYGHYIYVTGICMKKKEIYVADPSKGEKCHTFQQMEAAIRAVTWAPSILLIWR